MTMQLLEIVESDFTWAVLLHLPSVNKWRVIAQFTEKTFAYNLEGRLISQDPRLKQSLKVVPYSFVEACRYESLEALAL